MPFLNKVLSWFLKQRISQIEHFKDNPHEVQLEVFKKLIVSAKHTEWGKAHGYESIKTIEDFQSQVPISDYDQIKPYIERLRHGEKNLLWPTEVRWFAKSSGTTSDKSKFIPVTYEALEDCHFKGGKDMLAIYCHNNPETEIFSGKGLVLGGSNKISEFNSNSYFGDLSAILLQNFPFWAEMLRTPDLSIALMDNWELKLDIIAKSTITEDVTNISGVPSWNLMLLKKIIEITGRTNILEVWPNLEIFFHGGVSFIPYKEQFKKLIPSEQMNYLETYNASEGFFGIQDLRSLDEMLLMLDYGIFYEFIPMDELGKENPKALTLDKIELNKNYAMVISTNAGLWRYLIGDTVVFTSANPYRIKISGRTKNFINAFGEEIIVDNTDKALAKACALTNASMSDYTAAPIFLGDNNSAAHEYIIEFEKAPQNLSEFTKILDDTLKQLNSDYEAKRAADLLLKQPVINCASPGTFYEWLKSKGKVGGQNKVPRLFNDRRYIDEILKFANI
ncbi:MAG: GH3 auxin-responsive promoter family protein [Bacteroidetes bacterium]|nr:GH3 auxin-responsive promoter family protein [Bacteroidota bacterium]